MIDLPQNFTVRQFDNPPRVEYRNERNLTVLECVEDSDLNRRMLWIIYYQQYQREAAIAQRAHFLGLADSLDKQWKISDKYK